MTENMEISVMDNFNGDCLLEIFAYLSFDDMMQVKNVCRKWRELSDQWFKKVQTIVYNKTELIFDGTWELQENYLERTIYTGTNMNKLFSILQICGHHIKYYGLKYYKQEEFIREDEIFMYLLVPQLCKNIEIVAMRSNHELPPFTFEVMAMHWEKLEELYIGNFILRAESNFHKLLSKNKKLKVLSLSFHLCDPIDHPPVNDEFFSSLSTTIEKIYLKKMPISDKKPFRHFKSASKNFTSLHSLDFDDLYYLDNATVEAIVNIKSLKHLSLSNVRHYESPRIINQIVNLKGLISLNLLNNHDQYENSFLDIVKNCIQLEGIIISETYNNILSDKVMAAIAELKKLKCLFSDMKDVTIESIIKCDSLEILGCFLSKMNNSDAIKLLRKGTNLKFVYFGFCEKLTKDIIEAASEIAMERENILCISGCLNNDSDPDVDIDTPYFKYFKSIKYVPQEIFPENIRHYFEKLNVLCP